MHSTSKLDDGYLGSGTRLRRSIRKHGEMNHVREILETFETREALIEGEKKLITLDMLNDKMCMNLREGGTGGWSIEQQKRNGKVANAKMKILRETDPAWADNFSKGISNGLIEAYKSGSRIVKTPDRTGKAHTEETKQKMSESKKITSKGERNSQFGTVWMYNDEIGKSIKVNNSQVDSFIESGWYRGRKSKIRMLP